jgi:3-methylfumaryl-CoA hydratase
MEEVVAQDACTATTLRRVAAMLDQAPPDTGLMPRGWHVALFAPDPAQQALRPDGYAGVGVPLPDTGLPRLMFGGRRTRFLGDIPVGPTLVRRSRLLSAVPKTGRSGSIMIATVRHEIALDGAAVLTEEQDFVLLEAGRPAPVAAPVDATVAARTPTAGSVSFVADEAMLLRFCALTFNTHRIHYDHPYATDVEGYPALVVNGSLTTLMLTELFRARARREPVTLATRNLRPLFCARANTLHAREGDPWLVWAEDDAGARALEAQIA